MTRRAARASVAAIVSAACAAVVAGAAAVHTSESSAPGTPPTAELSGSLWEQRDVELPGDRVDAGYVVADERLDVSATEGARGAGVASVEMRVDGRQLRAEHLVSTCAPACPARATAGFTMYRSDVAAGDHEVQVIVRDPQAPPGSTTPGARTTVRAFVVHFEVPVSVPDDDYEDVPPPGSSADAPPLLAAEAAAATRSLIAAEARAPGSDLSRLLRGARYSVEEVGAMSQGADTSGRPRVVGTVAILRLARPQPVEAIVRCSRARPDMADVVPYRARVIGKSLRDLFVTIDLARRTVLCASPGLTSEADLVPLPGQPPLPAPSED